MSQASDKTSTMEVDVAFLRSVRGILKLGEMVTLFVAFVCYAVASRPKYIAVTVLELLITSLLLVLYILKLNKKLTFFFWPLIDVFNSVVAAAFLLVFSLMAVSTYTVKATLGGGIVGFMSVALLCADSYFIFTKITFNKPRDEVKTRHEEISE
ncbi:chemokine-like factor [Polymixia lowei]